MSKTKASQKKSTSKKAASKKPIRPSFTLIMSTLACLALLAGFYYTNKANNMKSKTLKEGSTDKTDEQKTKRNVYPTVKPSAQPTPTTSRNFNSKQETVKAAKPEKHEKKESKLKGGQQTPKNFESTAKPSSTPSTSSTAYQTASSNSTKTKPTEKQSTKQHENMKPSKSKSVNKGQEKKKKSLKDFKRVSRLNGIKVGHVRTMELQPGKFYKVKTRSLRPPIFEIPNFLTDEECKQIIDEAELQVLEPSYVEDPTTNTNFEPTNQQTFNEWDYNHDNVISPIEVMHNLVDLSDLYFSEKDIVQMFKDLNVDKNGNGAMELNEFLQVKIDRIMQYLHNLSHTLARVKSRNSNQTWVDHTTVKGLGERLATLTKLPLVVVSESEKLQVVQYGPEGHYHCHHDSQYIEEGVPCCYERDKRHCRLCRYITVLYFLNDVEAGGETAFPVADNATFSIEEWAGITKYRCDLSKHCHKANLYIPPKKGTAIMWYNHYVDPTTGWVGRVDPMTYHGGCDVIRGQKWIANNWINIMGESRARLVTHTNPKKRI